jgi:group I intron endonuclease
MAGAVSGIYAIKNTKTGDIYIGSSVTVHQRWYSHRSHLRRGIHHSPKLQRAWKKYGEDAFSFDILEVVPDASELFAREQRWLDELKPFADQRGYNNHPSAGGARGHKLSQAVRDAMSASRTGRKMPAMSPEQKAKLSAAAKTEKRLALLTERNRSPEMRAITAERNRSPEMRASTAQRNKSEAMRQITADRNRSEAMREVVRRPKSDAHRLALSGPLSEAHKQALRGPKSAEHAEKLRAVLARARAKKLSK